MVGTSGAIRTLARMAAASRGERVPQHAEGLVLERKALDALIETFLRTPSEQLAQMPGMDDRRVHTLPSGAVLLREIMKTLKLPALVTSERSLRDGLIVDWIERHRPEIDLARTIEDPRQRTVEYAAQRFGVDRAHAQFVEEKALVLFDALAELHELP